MELKFTDGCMIAIDTIAVESESADNTYQRSELDDLIYNASLEYTDLILNGDPVTYRKTVAEYKPLDSGAFYCPWEKSCGHFCYIPVNSIDTINTS